MEQTEAEDIKKRWQEYTEELYKKGLNDPDNHSDVITHLEPDILESEVKWTSESITTNKDSEDVGIPVELFQILKDDAMKVLQSICQQIWKTQQWPQDWKRSIISQANKILCKISKPGFNSTWTKNFKMFKLDLEKAKEPERSNCQYPLDHRESERVPEKHLLLPYWLCQSLWLCGSQQTVENS